MGLRFLGGLIGLLLIEACGSAKAQQQVLSCPATMPAKGSLPRGSRVMGRVQTPNASLFHAVVLASAPAKVTTEIISSPEEADMTETGDFTRVSIFYETKQASASLACFFGAGPSPTPGSKTAMLLLPLPSGLEGECIAMHPKRLRDGRGRRLAHRAACTNGYSPGAISN